MFICIQRKKLRSDLEVCLTCKACVQVLKLGRVYVQFVLTSDLCGVKRTEEFYVLLLILLLHVKKK